MIGEPSARPGLTSSARVVVLEDGKTRQTIDDLATEEPLEIRIVAGGETRSLAVTMRTPGNDYELAAGFLYCEGLLHERPDIAAITYCVDRTLTPEQRYNVVNVELSLPRLPDLERLERHFTVNSACGVCGKANIDALATRAAPLKDDLTVTPSFIASLPGKMREAQRLFAQTGGLHAAALFSSSGELLALREDVGRHNAVDKIAGWALLNQRLPLRGCILLVSGRASYELAQKSIVAGVPVLCAVSAPSSLSVELARAFDLTLIGFVRGTRANVYSADRRIAQ